jgi:oxygen-independent coproporphyrinogen III oxidase
MQGLYLHIPFCKQACLYCDFHFSTLLKNKEQLIDALCKEIELRKDYLPSKNYDTVYFGGGTPSLLSASELEQIFSTINANFDIRKNAEITFECNPDDLTPEKLAELKSAGVNRLSIGLQSFDDAELKWMNRAHTASDSAACVKRAQDSGFDNITIDLIYGSKFQTLKSWEHTLQKAVDLNVQHISSYNLTVEQKTALGNAVDKGKEIAVDDEKSSEEFLFMVDYLEARGFEQYEISNFAKPGFESKHNSNYWKGRHYIGIGPSAHSFNGLTRQWNISNNATYISAINSGQNYFETELLSTQNKFNEYLLTGLRTKWGCDLNYIRKMFGEDYVKHFTEKVLAYMPEMMRENKSVFTLTKKGKLFADRIASELFI